MSRHQSRNSGCQCSSARCSVLSPARSTLLGIFCCRSMFMAVLTSYALPVESRLVAGAEDLERPGFARPRWGDRKSSSARQTVARRYASPGSRAAEAQARFHAGQGVGREAARAPRVRCRISSSQSSSSGATVISPAATASCGGQKLSQLRATPLDRLTSAVEAGSAAGSCGLTVS